MDLDASVWSELQVELVERVLSFSSVPDLCRFRAVCKRWNELVCNPSFHDENNKRGARNHVYWFVTRYWVRGSTLMRTSTSFLDVDAMRWYNSNPNEKEDEPGTVWLAMDGGLMCELSQDASVQQYVISDAVTKRARRVLPSPPGPLSRSTVSMAVDPVSGSFKVVVIDNASSTVQGSALNVFVYESSSNQWRTLPNPPDAGFAWSGIIFREVLYIAFGDTRFAFSQERQSQPCVWRYDLAENVWGDVIEVTVLGKLKRPPQFVVSGDRLFLSMGVSSPNSQLSHETGEELVLEVREILNGKSLTMAQITVSDLKHMFDELGEDFHVACLVPCVNSEGLYKSITFVSALSGKILCYDLVSRSVDVLPALEALDDDDDADIPALLFCRGKPMKLSLGILTSPVGGLAPVEYLPLAIQLL